MGLAQERGARDRRRSRLARGAARAAARREALARRGCADAARASTSSTTATARCSTSARRATCARACARTSRADGSARRSRRPSGRSTASSGACSGRSSRPRSRSSGSSASCARLPTRVARGPERYVYLERRDKGWKVVSEPGPFGPLRSKRRAQLAARALDGLERRRSCGRAAAGAGEARAVSPATSASRTRRGCATGSAALEDRRRARRASSNACARRALCILAPAREPGFRRAFLVAGGRVASVRTVPDGEAGALELRAALAEAALAAAGPPRPPMPRATPTTCSSSPASSGVRARAPDRHARTPRDDLRLSSTRSRGSLRRNAWSRLCRGA